MTRRPSHLALGVAALTAVLSARTAAGQTTTASAADTGVRTLMSWLDDAEVIEPGGFQVSIAASRWRTQYGHETDFPSVSASAGIAPRLQIAASGLHYSSAYTDGFTSRGRGDAYVVAKFAAISPRDHPGGIAISPVIEILSDLTLAYRPAGSSRVSWGVPINLQYTSIKYRVYGSTGYFSRGSVFASAGAEVFVAPRVIATGSLLYSHETRTTPLSAQYALKPFHADANGGVSFLASDAVTLFGSVGRTVGGLDSTSTSVIATAGISVRVAGHSASP